MATKKTFLHKLLQELQSYGDWIFFSLPGAFGACVRYWLYRGRFKRCGKKIWIAPYVWLKGLKNIELGNHLSFGPNSTVCAESELGDSSIRIGNNVAFNHNVMVNADVCGSIIIEDNVLIGPNVVIRTAHHCFDSIEKPIREQGHVGGKIVIGEGVWIGANAVILPDVTIGQGAIIGAGAVVTKNVGAFDVVGGVPARLIHSRKDKKREAR